MTRALLLCLLITASALPGAALAQSPRAPAATSPVQGILQDQNQDQPIQIDAATLEVRDKEKMATFAGDVVVVQGDTTIKCQTLVVFYGAEHGAGKQATASAAPPTPAAPGSHQQAALAPQGAQDIRRIEARGGVTVISKEQNATGDLGVYDLKKKNITLTGNVTVSQGKNILHGDKVVVDTLTGNAHFESAGTSAQSRVRALILPSKNENGGGSSIMSIGPPKGN